MEQISVFDIFKVCIGPSSSHTMGPWLAAGTFAKLISDQKIKSIDIQLYGSLAKTGRGHGTPMALMLGLSGHDVATFEVQNLDRTLDRIKSEKQILIGKQTVPFDPEKNIELLNQVLPGHPNSMRFKATRMDGEKVEEVFYSIGGGFVLKEGSSEKISSQSGRVAEFPYPVQNEKDLLAWVEKTGLPISEIVLQNELSLRTREEINHDLEFLWQIMLECMYKGCHTQGVLPGGLKVQRRAASMCENLTGKNQTRNSSEWLTHLQSQEQDFEKLIQWVSCFALAVNEENASFGRVITAPTNGAAGVIPAVLMYMLCFCKNKSKKDLLPFFMTAGELGSLFKKGATLSAAMGGCQAEIGVSSAMAAGALTACLNGSNRQILMAAEIAMEHHLGLTCDPIAGLVQIPCIERNAMGAVKAITASQLALSSDPEKAKVSLDNIIKTMKDTAADMGEKFKETSEGGLAVNVPVSIPDC